MGAQAKACSPHSLAPVALALAAAMAGCGGKESSEAPSEPVVTVQAVRVQRSEIRQQVVSEAVLFPLHQAMIVPKITAPVLRFYVERGGRVHAGEVVAVLENKDLAAAVAESRGAYQQAEGNYETTAATTLPEQIQGAEAAVQTSEATLKAARQLYDSDKRLYQQGALAGKQLNEAEVGLTQAQTQYETAKGQLEKLQAGGEKAELKAAQGQLAAARGRYESAQAQLGYSQIRSPIDGVVTDRPLYPGEMATPSTPLMTVMDLSRVIARAHVPASAAARLKVGDSAEVAAPGVSQPAAGKVTVVSPALDPSSTTAQIWVEAANPHNQLKPGTAVTVTITAKKAADALVIPRSAVVSGPDASSAAMVIGSDGRAHQTKIQLGIEQGNRVQITQGLQEGELIVSQGAYGLPDGTKVKY